MATIRDVAKEAGLSTGTVSKALSTPEKVSAKNRLKVEAAIKKLKYKPNLLARRFRSSRANTIVVMVPDIANLFFAKLISGIENVAQQAGFNVLLGDTKDTFEREEAFVRMVETRLADGLINLRPSRSCEPLLARWLEGNRRAQGIFRYFVERIHLRNSTQYVRGRGNALLNNFLLIKANDV